MNAARFIHRANVARASQAPSGGKQTQPSVPNVITAMPCLIEALTSKQLDSLQGRVQQARFRISWGTEDVRNNDRVTVTIGPNSAVNKTFHLAELQDDTGRPTGRYQTAVLSELKL